MQRPLLSKAYEYDSLSRVRSHIIFRGGPKLSCLMPEGIRNSSRLQSDLKSTSQGTSNAKERLKLHAPLHRTMQHTSLKAERSL